MSTKVIRTSSADRSDRRPNLAVELGYVRVPVTRQRLDRPDRCLLRGGHSARSVSTAMCRSGAATGRLRLTALLAYGDVVVVHTLDRLGRNVRDTLDP
ncbi:recombinase family protein [Rhodococcus ruber]|uniref:recombinase family protein n=1 Tax=Rhodococcus ruber TaxID=1830 RepID=UPI001AE56A22